MNRKKKRKQLEARFFGALFYIDVPKKFDEVPQHLHQVKMRLWDNVIDEYLELLAAHVKSIDMLDLDETDITNDGIAYLTQMDFIKELRLKGINEIDNDCISHLNKIKELELLHVRGTSITLDGLLKLDNQAGLKHLLFSTDLEKPDETKMLQLRELMPDCRFTIDGKDYNFGDEESYMYL